jgi:hypothetical protein
MKLLILLFIGLAPLVILIPLFMLLLNLMIYGLQNRNICSIASLNVRNGFLLGVFLGPLGMLISLTRNNQLLQLLLIKVEERVMRQL